MSGHPLFDVDQQIRALVEIVGTVARSVNELSGRVDRLAAGDDATSSNDELAAWVWDGPAVSEGDPRLTVDNFVSFYNATYVGVEGTRAKPIPSCWKQHPGLAVEVVSLAYTWRTANVGAGANIRDAQQWHHQWRPGFADRMVRDWVHADCFDGVHRDSSG